MKLRNSDLDSVFQVVSWASEVLAAEVGFSVYQKLMFSV
ncbi:hypothetical protein CP8484711_0780A, partial [Chlamydia psittaci 84-8471/1]